MFLQARVWSLGPEYKSTATFRFKKGTRDTQGTCRTLRQRRAASWMMFQLTTASFAGASLPNQGA